MEITDHIIVNMLKKQLIDIYEKYTASARLHQRCSATLTFYMPITFW